MFYRFHPFKDKNKQGAGEPERKPFLVPGKWILAGMALLLSAASVYSVLLLKRSLFPDGIKEFPVTIEKLWRPDLSAPISDSTQSDTLPHLKQQNNKP